MADILIVDDDARVRRILRRILEGDGHQVVEAEDGTVALRRFAGHPADLVITDVYMEEMGGLEFLMRLREAWPEAKVVVMTGGGFIEGKDLLEAAGPLGAIATLSKPIEIDDVQTVVSRALSE